MRFSIDLFLALCNGEATFHKFIIITMILPFQHDSAIRWEEVLGVIWEAPVLDDLRALVDSGLL
jgi:hypothetical protein